MIIAFPNLVSGGLAKKADADLSNIQIDAPKGKYSDAPQPAVPSADTPSAPASGAGADPASEDPMEAVKRALQQDQKKK